MNLVCLLLVSHKVRLVGMRSGALRCMVSVWLVCCIRSVVDWICMCSCVVWPGCGGVGVVVI